MGIYKFTSPNGRVYIGQSINIFSRLKQYESLNCKKQPKIYRSLVKYGFYNHKFEIIEECVEDKLLERETYYKQYELNKVNNNWSKVLFCGLHDKGGGPISEETRLKISRANKGNTYRVGCINSKLTRLKISRANKGNKKPSRTLEHNHKISNTLKNREVTWGNKISKTKQLNPASPFKGKKHSEETKQKLRQKGKEIMCLKDGIVINTFFSVKEAARQLNTRNVAIHNAMEKNHKHKGFNWVYKT